MSKLRQTAEEVRDKLEAYAKELRKPKSCISAGKLERYAGALHSALKHEQQELDDTTGRRYGDNMTALVALLGSFVANGEKRNDAHETAMSLRDVLADIVGDDAFWQQQCQLARQILDKGDFPQYDDELPLKENKEAHDES